MNKKERDGKFEMNFKRSFCWRSNLSNDDIISSYARSKIGYENECGNWHFLVWNRVRIWRAGRSTPIRNSQENPLPPPLPHLRERLRWFSLPPLSFTALKAWGEYSGWVTGMPQRTKMLINFSPDFPTPWQIFLSGLNGVTFKVLLWQWRRWRCMFRFCASGMMFSLYRITKAKRFCLLICARKRFTVALITLVVTLIIHSTFFTPAKRQHEISPDETRSVLEKTIIPRQSARHGTVKLSGVEPVAGTFVFQSQFR